MYSAAIAPCKFASQKPYPLTATVALSIADRMHIYARTTAILDGRYNKSIDQIRLGPVIIER